MTKSETNPNDEIRKTGGSALHPGTLLRASGFGLLSDFGFRVSGLFPFFSP
jgi:hypothetical protein